jgi:hypothetical protein
MAGLSHFTLSHDPSPWEEGVDAPKPTEIDRDQTSGEYTVKLPLLTSGGVDV